MKLKDILHPSHIATLSDCQDGDALLNRLAGLLAGDRPQLCEGIIASLRQREQLGSTGIGHGVALPHGRNAAFDMARAAFVRLPRPIDYAAADGVPVDLVLALAVPADFAHQHLQLLADIAERFSNPALRQALRLAPDAATMHTLLTQDSP